MGINIYKQDGKFLVTEDVMVGIEVTHEQNVCEFDTLAEAKEYAACIAAEQGIEVNDLTNKSEKAKVTTAPAKKQFDGNGFTRVGAISTPEAAAVVKKKLKAKYPKIVFRTVENKHSKPAGKAVLFYAKGRGLDKVVIREPKTVANAAAATFDAADFLKNRALIHLFSGKREVKDPAKATMIQVGYEEGWIEPGQVPKLVPAIEKKYGGSWKFDHVDHFGAMGIGAAWFKKTNKAAKTGEKYRMWAYGTNQQQLADIDARIVRWQEQLDRWKDPAMGTKASSIAIEHGPKARAEAMKELASLKNQREKVLARIAAGKENAASATKPKSFRIVQTYDIVTPESSKKGEFAESGFEDEEGIGYKNTKQGIEDAASHIESEGATFYDHWFSTQARIGYQTGEERTDHFHVRVHVGESDARDFIQEKIIADKIAARMGLKLQRSVKSKAAHPAKATMIHVDNDSASKAHGNAAGKRWWDTETSPIAKKEVSRLAAKFGGNVKALEAFPAGSQGTGDNTKGVFFELRSSSDPKITKQAIYAFRYKRAPSWEHPSPVFITTKIVEFPRSEHVNYAAGPQLFVAYSAWFQSHKYDKVKIRKALVGAGAKNVHLEHHDGLSDHPEVVVFSGIADKTARDAVGKALKAKRVTIGKKSWRAKKKKAKPTAKKGSTLEGEMQELKEKMEPVEYYDPDKEELKESIAKAEKIIEKEKPAKKKKTKPAANKAAAKKIVGFVHTNIDGETGIFDPPSKVIGYLTGPEGAGVESLKGELSESDHVVAHVGLVHSDGSFSFDSDEEDDKSQGIVPGFNKLFGSWDMQDEAKLDAEIKAYVKQIREKIN